ncbi:chlorophyllide a oxygenase, chloroplastic-like isoform X2 [Lolium rigidum]|uniref:chlorophyllide a oxygenase, chloroplastic-like isoform X2 n=1 Tax=Lolium rigidum TaxID=89674 RepID=UPI001F5C4F3C|nr:chlorophyllide a oxygenase, chloroplastic-like isoform X2 [Lolium rigidum]
MTTAASLFLVPHLLIKPSFRCLSRKGVGRYGGIKVYPVLRDDGADYLKDNGPWEALFHVDDPGPRVPIELGKFLDTKQVLDVIRFTSSTATGGPSRTCSPSFVLHNKVVEVLNPLARDFKSVGNLRKDLAGLQEGLAKAQNQVGVCCFEVCFISKYSKCQNLAHHVLLAAMGFKFQIFHRHTVSLALRSMVHLPALK